MDIKSINNLQYLNIPSGVSRKKEQKEKSFGNNVSLPSVYPIGESLINKNSVISYCKIGEISIPGLKEKAHIYKLANGQRIIIAPKKGSAFVHTTYNVGSMNEPDNIRGISHFIEHNLFNGSKNLEPKEYDRKVCALGGDTNASTGFAATDYYLQFQLLHDNSLEEAIKLNAEQTQFPLFPSEQLIKEKEPVKSEIDMCSDNPNTVAVCKTLKNLFKVKTSSEDFIIGTKQNINSFTRDTVLDYFNTWYTPDNAVTVITGDVNPEEAVNFAAKYFNKQNDYSNIHKRYYEPISYNDKPIREDIIKTNTMQPSVTMGFAIPEGTNNVELNKLDILFSVMNSSNSNLYKELDKLGASFDITVENMQNKPNGAKAILLAAYAPEEKLEDTIKTIYCEIQNISNNPVPIQEINNSKKRTVNELLNIVESSSGLSHVLTNAALSNNYDYINSSIHNINNICANDISLSAKKYLDLNKVSICVSHDKDATAESIHNQYSKQISFGAKISPLNRIKEENDLVQSSTLPNNIESSVLSGNPYAKSCIYMLFNTDELNKTTSGEFMVLEKMLNRGSMLRSSEDFNDILNSKDIGMYLSADTNGLSIAIEAASENLQSSMKFMQEKLMYPNFTQEEFLRAKKLVKQSVLTENISAFDKLNNELHPEIKKYEDKETRLKEIEKLTLEDIQKLYSKIINGAQVQAVMTAPKSQELTNIFNNELMMLGNFRPFSINKGQNYNIYKPNTEEKMLVTQREQAQAEIVQGYKFKKSTNIDDIAKIELLNMILGAGGMSSRLFLDLRENKKLAYSVNSRISDEKDTGVLCLKIGTTTQSPDKKEGAPININKALEGFRENVELLKTKNVSMQELENAKNIYKTRILNSFETNNDKSMSYLDAKFTNYGINYNEKLFEAIDKIKPDDIRLAACFVFKNPPVTSIAASKNTLKELNLSNKF